MFDTGEGVDEIGRERGESGGAANPKEAARAVGTPSEMNMRTTAIARTVTNWEAFRRRKPCRLALVGISTRPAISVRRSPAFKVWVGFGRW